MPSTSNRRYRIPEIICEILRTQVKTVPVPVRVRTPISPESGVRSSQEQYYQVVQGTITACTVLVFALVPVPVCWIYSTVL
jgi:hypothetical protein